MRLPNEKDKDYCRRIIKEVDDFIPTQYLKFVRMMEELKGLEPLPEVTIRNVRAGITPNPTYAELFFEIGSILKNGLEKNGNILDVADIPAHLQPSN